MRFRGSSKVPPAVLLLFTILGSMLVFTAIHVPQIASAESLGAWTPTASYPFRVEGLSCAASGGYIYCVGGDYNQGFVDLVYFARISSSGVGAWTPTMDYPNYQYEISCAISGGYIYCVGAIGWTVYYAPITPITTSIYLSPSSGSVGTSVTIAGVGLNISHNLTVMYDNSTAGMPTTCTTDASGDISSGCTFTVPTSALGPHTVTVSDGTYIPTATFTVRVGWHIVLHGGGSHMSPRMIPT